MSFHQVLEKYRSIAFSEKDKGHRIERLMQGYLRTDPLYADQFSDVWQWGTPSASKSSERLPPIQTNRLGKLLKKAAVPVKPKSF
jgi:predicted helicase